MRVFSSDKIPKPKLEFDPNWLKHESLDLEIGAGQGLHAIRYARANPQRTLLAVEKTNDRFAKMSGRFETHEKPENLKLFHADAVAFATHFLADESLARVFLLYPNPYHKAKHSNLRWHNRPFMQLLIKRMKPGGQLTLATNLDWYAEEAARGLTETWGLDLLVKERIDPQTHIPRTHFEKKYLARGESCFNLILQKRCESDSIRA